MPNSRHNFFKAIWLINYRKHFLIYIIHIAIISSYQAHFNNLKTIFISQFAFLFTFLFYRSYLDDIYFRKCNFLLMITTESFFEGKLYFKNNFQVIPSLKAKLAEIVTSRTFVHRINTAFTDTHCKLQKFAVNALLFSTKRRVHYNQIHLFLS